MQQDQNHSKFDSTIKNQLQYSQNCPITFQASLIWLAINNNDQEQINIPNDQITQYQQKIDLTNQKTCQLLMYAIDVFIRGIHIPWKMKHDVILSFVNKKVKKQLRESKAGYPEFIQCRYEEYQERLLAITDKMVQGLYETLEDGVLSLINDRLNSTNLIRRLRKIIITQLQRLGYELFDFGYVSASISEKFFNHLKKAVFDVLYDFYTFLYKMSYFGNREMDYLNEIMHNYTLLANIDSYKVEMSKKIYRHVCALLEDQVFYRPEFYQYQSEIVIQALKHFYHFAESINLSFEIPLEPNSFLSVIKMIDPDVQLQSRQNIQVFSQLPSKLLETADTLKQEDSETNLLHLRVISKELGLNIFQNANQLFVEKIQDIKSLKNIGLVIQFQAPFNNYGPFFIGMVQNSIVITEVINLASNEWSAISSIEIFDDFPLNQFIAIQAINLQSLESLSDEAKRIKHASSLDKQNLEGLSFRTKQMISKDQIKQVLTISYDEYLTNPEVHHHHLQIPKKPIRYGATTEYVAGKTLGTGLGYLIVNCLDDDMPWDDKLKDAGYTTVTWGFIAILSSRLPIVGLIIQQALLAYAVTSTITNKVVNFEEKAKSLGHLAVQISLGVVCIVGGHILIPLHFWGAFMGGLSAGICIGLYSKFVVPESLASLQTMIEKMDRRITPQGSLNYSPIVVEIMKIKEQFFLDSKPHGLSKSEWLTLSMICLVNEVHYMYQLLLTKHIEKITKKREKNPQNQELLMEIEELKIKWIQNDVMMHDWKDCRNYILKQKLSILDNHHSLQEFIEGMIENFKID